MGENTFSNGKDSNDAKGADNARCMGQMADDVWQDADHEVANSSVIQNTTVTKPPGASEAEEQEWIRRHEVRFLMVLLLIAYCLLTNYNLFLVIFSFAHEGDFGSAEGCGPTETRGAAASQAGGGDGGSCGGTPSGPQINRGRRSTRPDREELDWHSVHV